MSPTPLLTVLVVTSRPKHRLALLDQLRAIRWTRKELVIVEHIPRGVTPVPLTLEIEDPSWVKVTHRVMADPPMGEVLTVADLRNLALKWVDGDYLTWVDDDDWRHPDHAAKIIEEMEAHPSISDGAGPNIGLWTGVSGHRIHQYKLPNDLPVFGASVFRSSVLGRALFPGGMVKGSDTIWVQKLRKSTERRGLRIGTTEGRMSMQTFVAVSHGSNLSNPEPHGEWVPALDAARLDACTCGEGNSFPSLTDHLKTIREGRESRETLMVMKL